MAANALIVLTQDGFTRPAGDAIHDGVTAKSVTIENDTGDTDVTSWEIEILDVPSGPLPGETSAIPTGVLASGGASAPLGNFTPDVPGTYFIRLTINGIEIDEVAVCVPNDQGWVNPAYNAGGDAYAFTGNDRGWAYFFDRILSYFRATVTTGVVFDEQASVPGGAPGAGKGTFWVKDDSPSTPYFTDDTGADHDLLSGGIGGGGTDDTLPMFTAGGTALTDSRLATPNSQELFWQYRGGGYKYLRVGDGVDPGDPGDHMYIDGGTAVDGAVGYPTGGNIDINAGDGGIQSGFGFGLYGGRIELRSGDGADAPAGGQPGDAGDINIDAGSSGTCVSSGTAVRTGGLVRLTGGRGSKSDAAAVNGGKGGPISISAGQGGIGDNAGNTSGDGGDVTITSGRPGFVYSGGGQGVAGNVNIDCGNFYSGTPGVMNFGATYAASMNVTPPMYLDQQSGDPGGVATKGAVYVKDVAGVTQLFFQRSNGTFVQIT